MMRYVGEMTHKFHGCKYLLRMMIVIILNKEKKGREGKGREYNRIEERKGEKYKKGQ